MSTEQAIHDARLAACEERAYILRFKLTGRTLRSWVPEWQRWMGCCWWL